MRPSVALDLKRNTVREAASRFRTANLRLFRSVSHRIAHGHSGIDLDGVWETGLQDLLMQRPAVRRDADDAERNKRC